MALDKLGKFHMNPAHAKFMDKNRDAAMESGEGEGVKAEAAHSSSMHHDGQGGYHVTIHHADGQVEHSGPHDYAEADHKVRMAHKQEESPASEASTEHEVDTEY